MKKMTMKPAMRNSAEASHRENLILVLLLVAFVAFRFWKFLNTENLVIWWDSAAYALVSIWPVGSGEFWFGRQPAFYPLLFKFFAYPSDAQGLLQGGFSQWFSFQPGIVYGLGDDEPFYFVRDHFDVTSMAALQSILATLSWAVFAVSCSRIFKRTSLRVIAAAVLLLLGCETMITLWDRHLMTEALSMSLMVLVLSFFLHYRAMIKSPAALLLLILIASFFSLIRMTNNYLLVFLLLLVAYLTWMKRPKHLIMPVILTCALSGLIAFNQYGIFKGDRGMFPLKSLVSSRISLTGFEDVYQYFRDHGMPEIPKSFHGQLWRAPYEDIPELNEWMKTGPSVYQQFLATHPIYFLTRPFATTNDLNKPVYEVLTPSLAPYEISEKSSLNMAFTNTFLWAALAGIVLLYVPLRKSVSLKSDRLAVILTLIAGSCATLIVVWHGDLVDIDRHAVQFALGLRVGMILLLFWLLEQWMDRRAGESNVTTAMPENS